MNTTLDIIRNRVDAGASGATVTSQSGNVVVQFPGVRDPAALIKLIGEDGPMQFRPVLCYAGPYSKPKSGRPPPRLPANCSSSSNELTASNLNVNTGTGQPTNSSISEDPALTSYPTTSSAYNNSHAKSNVLLAAAPGSGPNGLRYLLGPQRGPGQRRAQCPGRVNTPNWVVDVTFTCRAPSSGRPGQASTPTSPSILDRRRGLGSSHPPEPVHLHLVPGQDPDQRQLHAELGTEPSAGPELRRAACELHEPPRRQRAGRPDDRLSHTGEVLVNAGLAAGIGGLLLVMLYMIFYYRALGIVVISGLATTVAILWAIVSALGHTSMNLTLDLAGVTGVIVSIGITVDSYVVYFERLKDEVRSGRSVRTSVDRSFRGAFRTVLAADLVSLAAAIVLYLLAVDTVRVFAFFLGLATLLDIATTFFFTRPLVILLARPQRGRDAAHR